MYLRTIPATSRVCVGCGVTFRTTVATQTRCMSDCGRVRSNEDRNAARKRASDAYIPEFIGVDGEGVTHEDGTHHYVLLSVGERAFHRDGAQLQIEEIFEFLWECFLENPSAVYCGYCLGYDFEQWLRTLPQDRAAILLAPEKRARTKSGGNAVPFPVWYKDVWEFDLLGKKRFKLRRKGDKRWMYICDVGGYFQQTFVASMSDRWQDRNGQTIEIVTDDERAIIERGKAKRSTAKFDKEMMQYNCAENRVLARMMNVLANGFKELGVNLKRSEWFGPGQVAQKWLDEHSTHKAQILRDRSDKDDVFKKVLEASRDSYYGGWFETQAHGHCGDAWEYDISSAYPHILSELPCLLHGQWNYHKGSEAGTVDYPWTLIRASVRGDNPHIGAMLHRDKQGRINRPLYTSGWYWKHELDAARRAGLVCEVLAHEVYGYTPCACSPPLRALRQSFLERHAVGKKTPYGRAIKLKDNSVYGKQAQSIGLPKHANPLYASLTTAGTRAMICDTIATHPEGARSVLMIATDGIYFKARHPGLSDQDIALGNWEETEKRNLTIFLPGVYWDDVSREGRVEKATKLKSRGVSATDLIARLDALDREFDRMREGEIPWRAFEGDVDPDWWARLRLPIRFSMVSAKQALQRGKWDLAGTVSTTGERELWAHPRHKRNLVLAPDSEYDYIRTTPPKNAAKVATTPYDKSFGLELQNSQNASELLTPEGDAISEAYEVIK